jgi:hypothetical protein
MWPSMSLDSFITPCSTFKFWKILFIRRKLMIVYRMLMCRYNCYDHIPSSAILNKAEKANHNKNIVFVMIYMSVLNSHLFLPYFGEKSPLFSPNLQYYFTQCTVLLRRCCNMYAGVIGGHNRVKHFYICFNGGNLWKSFQKSTEPKKSSNLLARWSNGNIIKKSNVACGKY